MRPPILAFWMPLLLFPIIAVNATLSRFYRNRTGWLLAVAGFVWLLKTLFVPAYVPFFGSDSYITFAATQDIAQTGLGSPFSWAQATASNWPIDRSYPFLAGVSIAIVELSGVPLSQWARWGMTSLSLIALVLVFCIAKALFNSRRTALLSSLGFGVTYYFLMFESLFVREAIAFVLFLAVLFLLIVAEDSKGPVSGLLLVALAFALIASHHLTAFMLAVLVLLDVGVKLLIRIGHLRNQHQRRYSGTLTFMFLFIVSMVAYWVYLRYTPVRTIQALIEDAVAEPMSVSSLTSVLVTPRYTATLLLQSAAALIFGFLAITGLARFPIKSSTWHVTFVIWGGTLGLGAWLGMAGVLGRLGSFPSRLEVFGYALLLPAAAHGLTRTFASQRRTLEGLAMLTLVMHSGATYLRINPYLYSDTLPDVDRGEPRPVLTAEEVSLIERIRPTARGIVPGYFRGPARARQMNAQLISDVQAQSAMATRDFEYLVATDLGPGLGFPSSSSDVYGPYEKVFDSGYAELFVPHNGSPWQVSSILDPTPQGGSGGWMPAPSAPNVAWMPWVLATAAIVIPATALGRLLLASGGKPTGRMNCPLEGEALAVCVVLGLLFVGFLISDCLHWSPFVAYGGLLLITLGLLRSPPAARRPRLTENAMPKGLLPGLVTGMLATSMVGSAAFQAVTPASPPGPQVAVYVHETNASRTVLIFGIANGSSSRIRLNYQVLLAGVLLGREMEIEIPSGEATFVEVSVEGHFAHGSGSIAPVEILFGSIPGDSSERSLRLWAEVETVEPQGSQPLR